MFLTCAFLDEARQLHLKARSRPRHWGDCYRACLASILELPAAEVPHFIEVRRCAPEWRDDERDWLRARGLEAIVVTLKTPLPEILGFFGAANPGVHYIVAGIGHNGVPHAVVACGNRIVHDPAGVGIAESIEGQHVLTLVGHHSRPSPDVKPRP